MRLTDLRELREVYRMNRWGGQMGIGMFGFDASESRGWTHRAPLAISVGIEGRWLFYVVLGNRSGRRKRSAVRKLRVESVRPPMPRAVVKHSRWAVPTLRN